MEDADSIRGGPAGACIFRSRIGKKAASPVVNETAWGRAGQRAAFAHEMRLIELTGLMDNIGP
jgi:hypothetical protein